MPSDPEQPSEDAVAKALRIYRDQRTKGTVDRYEAIKLLVARGKLDPSVLVAEDLDAAMKISGQKDT